MDVRGYFGQVWTTSEGWKANCPKCEDKEKKFAWNDEKAIGCCFHSSCPWFYQRGGVTVARLKYYFKVTGVEHIVPVELEIAESADVKLPEEFKLIEDLDKNLRSTLYAYLSHRHIPKRVVDRAKIGYCESGKRWGYIIMPVFDGDGNVAYWQGRRFKNREPKFYNPKSSKKSELLYCISKTRTPRTIILVESVMNALTLENVGPCREIPIAILGKSLSETQRDKILWHERYLRELVIALDGDARRDAVAIASQFQDVVPAVKIVNIPDGEDVNSLGREKSWELIRRAEVFDPKRRMEFMLREV